MSYKLTDEERKDHNLVLAYERTLLAKDRTILSVLRTALTFIAVGAGFLGFKSEVFWFRHFGYACIAFGIASFLIGSYFMVRYHVRLSRFSHLKEDSTDVK